MYSNLLQDIYSSYSVYSSGSVALSGVGLWYEQCSSVAASADNVIIYQQVNSNPIDFDMSLDESDMTFIQFSIYTISDISAITIAKEVQSWLKGQIFTNLSTAKTIYTQKVSYIGPRLDDNGGYYIFLEYKIYEQIIN